MSITTRTRRRTAGSAAAVAAASFLLLAGAGILAAPTAFAGVPGGTAAVDRNSDFNGDGYSDLLTGVPEGTVDGKEGAGYVTAQYGAPNGIGTNTTVPKGRVQLVSQSTKGVPGTSETGDHFGQAVATGDLDGDGYDDAVIGTPGEDEGTVEDAGRVTVVYGSANGLDTGRTATVAAASPAEGARFGHSVAAARFTGDIDGDQLVVLDQKVGLHVFTYHAACPAPGRHPALHRPHPPVRLPDHRRLRQRRLRRPRRLRLQPRRRLHQGLVGALRGRRGGPELRARPARRPGHRLRRHQRRRLRRPRRRPAQRRGRGGR